MARITAADVSQLEDDEPYVMEITGMSFEESDHPQFGHQKRLRVTLAFVDESGQANREDTILDWLGLKLGQQQSGEIAKLRQLLNALAEEPKETTIAWFDDETLEWSYDGNEAAMQLAEGRRVVVRGELVTKVGLDGTPVRRYRVKKYQPIKKNRPKSGNGAAQTPRAPVAPTTTAVQTARRTVAETADVDPDEIPF